MRMLTQRLRSNAVASERRNFDKSRGVLKAALVFVALLALLESAPRMCAQVAPGPPLSKSEVIRMLTNYVSAKVVAEYVRVSKISFQVTPEVESELRKAGADRALIRTLREAGPSTAASHNAQPAPKFVGIPPAAALVIRTFPGGVSVIIDNQSRGTTPNDGHMTISGLAPGNHQVLLRLEGYADDEKEVTLASGQTLDLPMTLSPLPPHFVIDRTLAGQNAPILALAFSADGTLLASGSESSYVLVWNASTGIESETLPSLSQPASSQVSGEHKRHHKHHKAKKAKKSSGPGYTDPIAFNPDLSLVALTVGSSMIVVRDMKTGRQISTFTVGLGDLVECLVFSPDGRTLATGILRGKLAIWDMTTRWSRLIPITSGWIFSLAFSPDGRTLASAGGDGTVRLLDVPTGRELRALPFSHQGRVTWCTLVFNRRRLVVAQEANIELWNPATGRLVHNITPGLISHSIALTSGGRFLAWASLEHHSVTLWDTEAGDQVGTLSEGGTPTALAFSPDGRRLAVGYLGGTVQLWRQVSDSEIARAAP